MNSTIDPAMGQIRRKSEQTNVKRDRPQYSTERTISKLPIIFSPFAGFLCKKRAKLQSARKEPYYRYRFGLSEANQARFEENEVDSSAARGVLSTFRPFTTIIEL